MKTRTREAGGPGALPPPPAPTARYANPWTLPSGDAPATRVHRHPRAPDRPKGMPEPRATSQDPSLRRRWMPLAVFGFVAATGVQMALMAFARGDVEAAVGALLLLGMVLLVAVRQLRKGKR